MRNLVVPFALLFALACKGGPSDAVDASNVVPSGDAGTSLGDGGNGGSAGDAGLLDAGPAPTPDANTAFEPVDCRGDDECTGDLRCSTEVPGGVCAGCSEDEQCGDGLRCRFGTCERLCEDDSDCSPGRSCTFGGRCGQLSCNQNNPCPAPYECVGNFNRRCERPACNDNGSCAEGFVCNTSEQLCMEP